MIPDTFYRTASRLNDGIEIVEYQHPTGVWFAYAVDLFRPETDMLQRQRCEDAIEECISRKYPELLR